MLFRSATFGLIDAAMMARTISGKARPWLGMSSVSIAAVVAYQSAIYHGAVLGPSVARAALPHVATAITLCFARGWMLAFLAIRWGMLMVGWYHWEPSLAAWIAHQWIQAALFAAWAKSTRAPKG